MRPKVIANCNRAIAKGGANKGIRLGARSLAEFRNARVNFGKSYGSCEVVYEPGTRVFAQISASIGEPMDSRPGDGVLTISVWVSPAATGEMVGNSKTPSLIARTLERLFKENKAIDLESLCIKFGEKAWILRADVHILDVNGCLQECAVLAVLGAFLTFRRPNAYIDPETDKLVVESIEESTPVKLHLFHLPMLTSFAICNGKLLAEPCQEEEEIFPGKLVLGITDSKEICYMHLTNPASEELLLEATKVAQNQCLKRVAWLKELVAKNIEEREVPVYMRPQDVRKDGTEIEISDLEKNFSLLTDEVVPPKSKKSKDKSKSGVPKISTNDIRILEEMSL